MRAYAVARVEPGALGVPRGAQPLAGLFLLVDPEGQLVHLPFGVFKSTRRLGVCCLEVSETRLDLPAPLILLFSLLDGGALQLGRAAGHAGLERLDLLHPATGLGAPRTLLGGKVGSLPVQVGQPGVHVGQLTLPDVAGVGRRDHEPRLIRARGDLLERFPELPLAGGQLPFVILERLVREACEQIREAVHTVLHGLFVHATGQLKELLALFLPLQAGEAVGVGEHTEDVRGRQMLRHPGVELAHFFWHIVDRVFRLVALEDGLRGAARLTPDLPERAPQRVQPTVHAEPTFHRCARASERLARLDAFDFAVLPLLRVFAEKQPEEGVHQGGLARAVIAADDVRPVREADLDVPRTAEVQ